MQCKNHPNVMAVDRCAGCAEAFCPNCLVSIQGKNYCASCKVMTVQQQPVFEQTTVPCSEATGALILAIVGAVLWIFCLFGIVLEPIAIVLAIRAKHMIAMNPRLSGSGMATAALVIGIVVTCLSAVGLLGMIIRAASH